MLTQFTSGQANKALVNLLTAVATGLALYYGNARWEPVVILAIGAVIHYLVPNIPAPDDPPPPTGGM